MPLRPRANKDIELFARLEFNFSKRASVMASGPYGPRIVPGKPDQSLIVNNLSLTHAPVKTMPPVGNRLTPDETKILRKWISEGAPWPAE